MSAPFPSASLYSSLASAGSTDNKCEEWRCLRERKEGSSNIYVFESAVLLFTRRVSNFWHQQKREECHSGWQVASFTVPEPWGIVCMYF